MPTSLDEQVRGFSKLEIRLCVNWFGRALPAQL
jgi:hypothetical protein